MIKLRMQLENAKQNLAEMGRQIKTLEGNLKSKKDDVLLGKIKQPKQMLSAKDATFNNIGLTRKGKKT